MAEAQYTKFVGFKVTPEMKKEIDKQLPNPSDFLREAIKKALESKHAN